MAKKNKILFVDGWTTLQKKWPKKTWTGQQWANWDGSGDWACHTCDPYQRGQIDTYEGNYGTDKWCRGCGGPKGDTQHMLMSVRREKIQAGSFLTRDEARARRLAKEAGESADGW